MSMAGEMEKTNPARSTVIKISPERLSVIDFFISRNTVSKIRTQTQTRIPTKACIT